MFCQKIYHKYKIFTFFLIFFFSSFTISKKILKEEIVINETKIEKTEIKLVVDTLNGWWIYGEGQHIFKDEETLDEWDVDFLNEEEQEIKELYLSICEMEYFPIECQMTGTVSNGVLYVISFKIYHIEGCDE